VIRRLLLLPYTFVLLNWAAIRALACYLRGDGAETLWRAPTGSERRSAGAAEP
jgi:hypothetical protein